MFNAQKSTLLAVFIGLMMMLSGCSRWRIGEQPVDQETVATSELAGVTVTVKLLSSDEATRMLGVSPYSAGYVPFLLGIYNNTANMLFLRGQSIHVPLADPNEVAKDLHYPTGRFTFYLSYFSALYYWPALVPVLGAGYYMNQMNKEVDSAIYVTGFGKYDSVEILPKEYAARVFFVRARDVTSNIRLHLFNMRTNVFIPFSLELHTVEKPLPVNELVVETEAKVATNDIV